MPDRALRFPFLNWITGEFCKVRLCGFNHGHSAGVSLAVRVSGSTC